MASMRVWSGMAAGVVLGSVAMAGSSVAQDGFVVLPLPTGASAGSALALCPVGDTVVGTVTVNFAPKPCVWSGVCGTPTSDFYPWTGGSDAVAGTCRACGFDGADLVVVGDAIGANGPTVATRWVGGVATQTVPPAGFPAYSLFWDVSADGSMGVGESSGAGFMPRYPLLNDMIPNLLPGVTSYAITCLSPSGNLLGLSADGADRAYLYDAANNAVVRELLGGSGGTSVYDVLDDGRACGAGIDPATGLFPIKWDVDGTAHPLETPSPIYPSGEALAMQDNGNVFGWCYGNDGFKDGMRWGVANGSAAQLVQEYLGGAGIGVPANHRIEDVQSVSSNGMRVCGTVRDDGGIEVPFVVNLPLACDPDPCARGDFNGDGMTDLADVPAFGDLFQSNDPAGDLDGDGDTDLDDYSLASHLIHECLHAGPGGPVTPEATGAPSPECTEGRLTLGLSDIGESKLAAGYLAIVMDDPQYTIAGSPTPDHAAPSVEGVAADPAQGCGTWVGRTWSESEFPDSPWTVIPDGDCLPDSCSLAFFGSTVGVIDSGITGPGPVAQVGIEGPEVGLDVVPSGTGARSTPAQVIGHLHLEILTLANAPDWAAFDFDIRVAAQCDGDIDGDHDTDVFDFALFAASFTTNVPPGTSGDFDRNGIVDVFDFPVIAADFECGGM